MQLSMISGKQLKEMVKKSQCEDQTFLCFVETDYGMSKCKANAELEPLLSEYSSIFQRSTSLPPHRGLGHSIPLKEVVKPIKQQPYRYTYM